MHPLVPQRKKLIGSRWHDIAKYGLSAFILAWLALASIPNCQGLIESVTYPRIALVLAFFYLVARKQRFSAWAGLRHLPYYPPAWVASVLGVVGLHTYIAFNPWSERTIGCFSAQATQFFRSGDFKLVFYGTIFFLVVLCCSGWALLSRQALQNERNQLRKDLLIDARHVHEPSLVLNDSQALDNWLRNDRAISHPGSDAFGHSAIAKRIAERLTPLQGGSPAIALVGDIGTGKSSVLNLVRYELLRSKAWGREVKVIVVSLWPFDSIEAAIRGILNALTMELGLHVNTTPISGLTDEYIRLIENASGGLLKDIGTGFSRLIREPSDPFTALRQYSIIASTINIHLVLWVEDVERFTGKAGSVQYPEMERLEPIRSLLHSLSEFDFIQVVWASATLGARFDVEKIARFVEAIPRMDEVDFLSILRTFRRRSLGDLEKAGLIDPVSPRVRRNLATELDQIVQSESGQNKGRINIWRALFIVCSTPRRLKLSLRQCQDVWGVLAGEVEFDDLMSMSILRIADPDVFSEVVSHIDEIRDDSKSHRIGADAEAKSSFARKIDVLLEDSREERRDAIECILGFIFPGWKGSGFGEESLKPQGLAVSNPRNYWGRYLSIVQVTQEESDQFVLRAINQWKIERNVFLLDILSAGDHASSVEWFLPCLLTPGETVSLIDAFVRHELGRSRENAVNYSSRGIRSLQNVLMRIVVVPRDLFLALLSLVTITTPKDIVLASSVIRTFASESTMFLANEHKERLAERFRTILIEVFAGNPNAIVKALDGCPYWFLYEISGFHSAGNKRRPFKEWSVLSDSVLQAAECNPVVMLPQIIPLVCDEVSPLMRDPGEAAYNLNNRLAGEIFDFGRLMRIFAHQWVSSGMPEEVRQSGQGVHESALVYLGLGLT
ncbi:hypothetical protein [Archangium primigenium]|uniref:hypothetical protein n=1 Tax=[Archangium] primigenium TaxID=2792470 RepID=UPI001959A481|nr:hypothetical protein [Archangium primigenium]MBM7115788.1 hypothetical protein [Archangium primigenium]